MITAKPKAKSNKGREQAIKVLTNKYGFEAETINGYTTLKKDGKKYDVKVHMMPFRDKCIIVSYDEFTTKANRFDRFLFINPMTDFQDVVYTAEIKNLKEFIDKNIGKPKNKFIWPSTQDEKLLCDNQNFFGVTIEISELEKQEWFTSIHHQSMVSKMHGDLAIFEQE